MRKMFGPINLALTGPRGIVPAITAYMIHVQMCKYSKGLLIMDVFFIMCYMVSHYYYDLPLAFSSLIEECTLALDILVLNIFCVDVLAIAGWCQQQFCS